MINTDSERLVVEVEGKSAEIGPLDYFPEDAMVIVSKESTVHLLRIITRMDVDGKSVQVRFWMNPRTFEIVEPKGFVFK